MDEAALAPLNTSTGDLARVPERTPLHAPKPINPNLNGPLREASWNALNPAVQTKLITRAGRIIEWFAQPDGPDRRPRAYVLGTHALVVAQPRIATDHHRIYAINTYELDSDSFRYKDINHRPGSEPHRPTATTGPPSSPLKGLSTDIAGVLGNLPPTAQELLQAPFLTGAGIDRAATYYEGDQHHLSTFLLVLAGRNHLTAAYGTRTIPHGHTEAQAHWSLTCLRATARRRS